MKSLNSATKKLKARILHRPQLTTAILGGLLLLSQTATAHTSAARVPPLATGAQQATTSLTAFTNGEHQLKAGETQSFRIHLIAGQFLHALIEQNDIDVVVASYGPDGKQVGETDSPNDRWDSSVDRCCVTWTLNDLVCRR